ncbi:Protein ApaG [Gracilariopsis chorda]|uniref:Protein ApaG n=1 Tax=Gracilariopsis chorda TaxID=448386 RepID=A0A2V3IWF6_9FLOR|nr:Protein ApaG [Gracilariopsis chorda]|eukprot:PXF46425.1 Protein ApaG [Gracilariopsis chorda]
MGCSFVLAPPFRARRTGATCCARRDASSPSSEREKRHATFRTLRGLQKQLNDAVKEQQFAQAATLRDRIRDIRLNDDYCRTELALRDAVSEERFAEAARLRDALALMEPPPLLSGMHEEEDAVGVRGAREGVLTPHVSVTDSFGIRVRARSYYVPEQSAPQQNRFLFGYDIRIENRSQHVCQLVSRNWTIRTTSGARDTQVSGAGVVGRQPVLMPGESYDYSSACPISVVPDEDMRRVLGSMKGHFVFCRGDTGDVRFNVDVGAFYFHLPPQI